jgi:hypothetical protein
MASAQAWPGRSAAQRVEFRKANPCPATGRVSGACLGYEIDHVTPLKCGGTDTPDNMQWLTVADHKAKTKAEARLCRPARRASAPSI